MPKNTRRSLVRFQPSPDRLLVRRADDIMGEGNDHSQTIILTDADHHVRAFFGIRCRTGLLEDVLDDHFLRSQTAGG